jgi:nucleotide-binding universal stress UspA family protein
MTMSSDTFEGRVVVAVHGDRPSEEAVRWGVDEARLHGHGLTLVHVLTPLLLDEQNPELRQRIRRWRDHRARQLLNDVKHEIVSQSAFGLDDVRLLLRFGSPVVELTDVSRTAEMLVVGSRFHGSVGGRRLGSVSAALSYRAHCPITVVHHYDETRSQTPVLVGIDGSPASEAATEIAFDEAARRGVGVIAVHAWSDVGVVPLLGMDWHEYREKAAEVLAERLAGWQEDYPDVRIERQVCCDVPAHALQAEARRAGLVVVGSRGRGATATMVLGSVATAVAEGVDVPVIITRDN